MIWFLLCLGGLIFLFSMPWNIQLAAEWELDGKIGGKVYVGGVRIKRIPDLLAFTSRAGKKSQAKKSGRQGRSTLSRLAIHLANYCRVIIKPNCLLWDPAAIWNSAGWARAFPFALEIAVRPWPLPPEVLGALHASARIRPLMVMMKLLLHDNVISTPTVSNNIYHGEANTMSKVEQILGDVERMISTKTVIGEPMTTGGITLIPVTSVSFGLGTGERGEDRGQADGVATGFRVSPVAVIVIRDGAVSVLPVNSSANPERLIGMLPDLWEKLRGKKEKAEEQTENTDQVPSNS